MVRIHMIGPGRLVGGLARADSRRGPDETTHTEILTPSLCFLRYMNDTPVDAGEVRHVVELAWVDLDKDEVGELTTRFADILGYFDALDEVPEVDREDELVNVMCPDKVRDGLTQEEVLSNVAETEDDFFENPRISQMSLNALITKETLGGSDDDPLADGSVAIKDNTSTEGLRTTCGSVMLEGYVPLYSTTVVKLLKDAGATIAGRADMDEFGTGTTAETSAFGPTKNPVDEFRTSGGSFGDSAATVAADEIDLAFGTDTGGFIRCPAAFYGAVGIKPTYGLVSYYGPVAYANSLEQISLVAPTVEGAAALLDVIAGPDDQDDTIRDAGTGSSYATAAGGDVKGLTIGVPTESIEGADEGVEEAFWAAFDELETQGTEYREVSMPPVEGAIAAYYAIAMSEVSSNLARFDGVCHGKSGGYDGNWNEALACAHEDGFGSEVKHRILFGTCALSVDYCGKYYAETQDVRAWVKQDFDEAFEDVDMVASLTTSVSPLELGESLGDPLQMHPAGMNTVPANLANLLIISVPVDKTDGLPVGLQLIDPEFDEKTITRAASAVEN